MITRFSSLFLIVAFLLIARVYPYGAEAGAQGGAAISLGFIILFGFLAGELLTLIQLPRISGYLLAGAAAGPQAFGLLTEAQVDGLRLIDQIALSLIALSAGAELHLKEIRKIWKGVVSVCLFQSLFLYSLGAAVFLAASYWMPVLGPWTVNVYLPAALIFGAIAISQSPATTIAILNETKCKGVAADLALSVTVLIDVVVIVLFTITMSVCRVIAEGLDTLTWEPVWYLARKLVLSLALGCAGGWLIAFFYRRIKTDPVLFILAFSYLAYQGSHSIALDPILICVIAGAWASNTSTESGAFLHSIEKGGTIIFVIFFCVAGAALDLNAVQQMGGLALVITVGRAAVMWLSTWIGVKAVRVSVPSPNTFWMAFLPQAGVSLGLLAVVAKETYPWTEAFATLLIASIAMNQVAGPVAMKIAFQRNRAPEPENGQGED